MVPARVTALSGRVIITEIKLGGGADPKQFIEIFNDTGAPVDLSTYALEYAKLGFPANFCSETSWKDVASPSTLVTKVTLGGVLVPGQFHVVELSMNDSTSGSARLIFATEQSFSVQDIAGWGPERPCYSSVLADIPANGQSLQRPFDESGAPLLNILAPSKEFIIEDIPTPGLIPCETDCQPEEPEVPEEPEEEEAPIYHAVQITELLPDPGSPKLDSQDEYIELYNPHDFAVDLSGYVLNSGSPSSSQQFPMNGVILQPQEYRVFYSVATSLNLVNSSPGQAWLTAPNFVRVSETPAYPANMGENKAWALISGTWQVSSNLTPAAANAAAVVEAEPTAVSEPEPEAEAEPCPAGKFRNPETNRCKNIEVAAAELTPCSPGQRRNPDTNRCRSITATSSTLTACQSGYERNPETNRCRKIAAVKGTSTDAAAGSAAKSKLNYAIIGSVSVLVLAYAVYEYRKDILAAYSRLKNYTNRGAR